MSATPRPLLFSSGFLEGISVWGNPYHEKPVATDWNCTANYTSQRSLALGQKNGPPARHDVVVEFSVHLPFFLSGKRYSDFLLASPQLGEWLSSEKPRVWGTCYGFPSQISYDPRGVLVHPFYALPEHISGYFGMRIEKFVAEDTEETEDAPDALHHK